MNDDSGQFALFGRDLFGDPVRRSPSSVLAERFIAPPFSVLDARSGEWQDRKRAWLSLGIKSEIGREEELALPNGTSMSGFSGYDSLRGTSVFDPVMCEFAYSSWSWPGAQILDPFAGGSVRGIVAGCLGRRYWGCDLRPEQVEANVEQAASIACECPPEYVCGDSRERVASDAPAADFIFSCPPYGDLEQYSDDPRDLSNMEFDAFVVAYRDIVAAAVARLRRDRFAAFVVGDFRDSRGVLRNFVSITIDAFLRAGADLYNDAVFAYPIASAAMRAGRQFSAGRKLVRVHGNLLVFSYGDARAAADRCKEGA